MSARQFYITLFVITISLKVQKLPSLISAELGKDSYLLVIAYLAVNIIGILLAFFILNHTKNYTLQAQTKSLFLTAIKKIILLALVVYFLSQSLLLYESIQNLFSHVLFYELPWTLFSLMLAAAVFYLAFTGIKNISLNFELYATVIVISYIVISIFGGTKTDFGAILPLQTIDFKSIGEGFLDFNLWFGDFFFVLFLGKNAKHIKLKWTMLVYTVSMLFVSLLYVEFFGIYMDYTPMKPSLISVLSEQSMLGVNIGRIDWFFILFTEIGTILSAGACLYFASKCLSFVLPKVNKNLLIFILTLGIYLFDIFYLVDIHKQVELFVDTMKYVSLAIKVITLVLMLFICFIEKSKYKNKSNFAKISEKPCKETKIKNLKTAGGKR